MSLQRLALIALLLLLHSGCGPAELRDISDSAPYRSQIGRSFETGTPITAALVSLERDFSRASTAVLLYPVPGPAGPEVLSEEIVPIGREVSVVGVYDVETMFGLFRDYLFRVDVEGCAVCVNVATYVYVKPSNSGSTILEPDGLLQFNESSE